MALLQRPCRSESPCVLVECARLLAHSCESFGHNGFGEPKDDGCRDAQTCVGHAARAVRQKSAEVVMRHAYEEAWEEVTKPIVRPAGAVGSRVLVVDDDGAMRKLVCSHLAAEGYEAYEAASGVALLHALESVAVERWPLAGIDVTVLDNKMPGMTGLEAIRRLRAAHWETPAILMTAFPDAETTQEAVALNVLVLPKPFALGLLTSAVVLSLFSKADRPEHHGFRAPS